jgi:hypothetical protein
MNYNASVSDFFKIPNWKTNLLLGAVSILIPMVGPLVLAGWHVTCLWARGNADDPAGFPPFNFDFFLKYLERGLWPFLVNLVASLVLIPVIMCLVFPLMFFTGVFDSGKNPDSGAVVGVVVVGFFVIQIGLMLAYQVLVTPLMLRATITQDFKSAFDLAFMKAFVSRVWKELLAAMVFMFGLGLCTMIITVVTCYIGMFFVMPVVIFSWHHLQKQLYQLYLKRGGEPVPLSPKLMDLPPALPGA